MKSFLVLFVLMTSVSSAQIFAVTNANGEARDKTIDVLHYKIELSFDESKKMIIGTTTITFVPFFPELRDAEFDAEDMSFSSVTMGKKSLTYDSLEKSIRVHLGRAYSFHDTVTLSFAYISLPKKGAYFIQPDSGYPNKPRQIWSQGEDMDNHHWFPCYDFPNDKATSEITGTVKSNEVFLSNGRLVRTSKNTKAGTTTYQWKQEQPHSSYLIMFAVGEYAILRDSADGVPLEYYVYENHIDDARVCFSSSPSIMRFFNAVTGFHYAWDKYAQVIIADFMFGGMENSSATTLLDIATVYDARARIDQQPVSLIAHEMAHQWWGDVVTCKDWRHLWLNESFASYFDPLYFEHAYGADEFRNIMYDAQQSGIRVDTTRGRKPIVSVGSYGENIYPRGASVLHMLRYVLGDQLFWKALHHYITANQFEPVETNDFKKAIEEATGQNLYWFFDQWVYKAGYPKFDVSYRYNDSSNTVAVRIQQVQKMDSLTGIFQTPVDIEIVTPSGAATHRISIDRQDSTYILPSAEKPMLVLFDKDDWILKEVHYSNRSLEEWEYQAESGHDVVARRTAASQLALLDSAGNTLSVLCRIARHDPFWAVRRSAIEALGAVNTITGEKASALIDAVLHDPDAKVRASAASQLGTCPSPEVSAALQHALNDSSYATEAHALASLARVDSSRALPYIQERLNKSSYRNQIANAALNALAGVDSSAALGVALQKVRYGEEPDGRNTAMNILTKYGKGRDDVKGVMETLRSDKNGFIKRKAAAFLSKK